jgi:hypothetical protein
MYSLLTTTASSSLGRTKMSYTSTTSGDEGVEPWLPTDIVELDAAVPRVRSKEENWYACAV